MRVLAIDQGSHCCGFAVGKIGGGAITRLQNHGRIVDGMSGLLFRLAALKISFVSLIEQYRPDVVLVEDIYYAALKTKATIYAMAGVTLMAEMAAADCLVLSFERMNVSTVRKVLGVKDKAGVRGRVSTVLSLPLEQIMDDNHSDALGLLLAYAMTGGRK